VTASTDPPTRRTRFAERARVQRPGQREKPGGVALVDGVRLPRAEFDAVERLGHRVVNEEALDDADDLLDVARRKRRSVEGGEAARSRVEVE